ncbi:D-ribose pyranase [Paenibacillus sp. CECT 9249]|uniref:D-ribose pyranase n=1 Tax=Paenibacillus sp. CECT 9249 TaxID=2845385 RepID=UPI001E3E0F14|nr:D-ribose pyranase [Paenibacillus sp. CECT 9249]
MNIENGSFMFNKGQTLHGNVVTISEGRKQTNTYDNKIKFHVKSLDTSFGGIGVKKQGVLHNELAQVIAQAGHEDLIVIGDAGLPIPKGVKCIDLALAEGIPSFIDTLRIILSELKVQEAIIDIEMNQVSPHIQDQLNHVIQGQFALRAIPHKELQELAKNAKVIVRTGEFTPYSNIILVAGVMF